jgi:hypothetical protein
VDNVLEDKLFKILEIEKAYKALIFNVLWAFLIELGWVGFFGFCRIFRIGYFFLDFLRKTKR